MSGWKCRACGAVAHTHCKRDAQQCTLQPQEGAGFLSRFANLGRVVESVKSIVAPEVDVVNHETGPLFKMSENVVLGGIRGMQQESSSTFRVYSITLLDVETYFHGNRCTWNRNYQAAQQIFGDGASCSLARMSIRAMHANVYRKGSSFRTKRGYLKSGDDLLTLLKFGERRRLSQFFTYIIGLDNKLRCCETGVEFTLDFTSKHAMHANCQEEVYYAGEFHVRKNGIGTEKVTYTLVLDNNSGTYAPPVQYAPILLELFRANFPGLDVIFVSYEDKELQETRKKVVEMKKDESWTTESDVDFSKLHMIDSSSHSDKPKTINNNSASPHSPTTTAPTANYDDANYINYVNNFDFPTLTGTVPTCEQPQRFDVTQMSSPPSPHGRYATLSVSSGATVSPSAEDSMTASRSPRHRYDHANASSAQATRRPLPTPPLVSGSQSDTPNGTTFPSPQTPQNMNNT